MQKRKGSGKKSDEILEFTRKHARFLLVTVVFGSITGVGIWFVISLVSHCGNIILIHFVFGWAAEWVFFLVELATFFHLFYMFM